MTPAAASPAPPAHASRGTEAAGRLLSLAAVLLAFYVAYSGVRMLEDRQDTTRAVVRFILATIVLLLAVRHATAADEPIASSNVQPSITDRLATSWQGAWWWVLLIAGMGLGIAFRVHELRSQPYGIWFDEAQNGIVARTILDGAHPIFVGGPTQLPALMFYAFAAGLAIFGDNITSLRAVTTAAGVLNIVFVYLLARELFDHRTGVLAAFFLAVMRWHVNFSRFAMHGVFAPLFMVATFYFLVRGLKGKGTWNFAASGMMAAVGLQTYYSFALVPVVVALYVLHHVISERVLPWRKLLTGLRIFALGAIIVYAPLGDWAIHHWDTFNQRANTVSVTKNRSPSEVYHVVVKSTKKHLLMFSGAGDRNGRHNIPGRPMLDTSTGFLFVLGAGYALARIRSAAHFLLLIWAAITLQSGIWSVEFEAPQSYRTVAITPAIAMLAALPLAQFWRVAAGPSGDSSDDRERAGSGRMRFGTPGLITTAAALGVTAFLLGDAARTNFHDYFDVQLVRADSWAQYSTAPTTIAKEMSRLGSDKDYRIAAVLQNDPSIRFLHPTLNPDAVKRLDWPIDLPASTTRDTVYLLDDTKRPFRDWLRSLYPGATFREFGPPLGGDPIILYEAVIPGDQVLALRGLDARYTPANGAPVLRREEALNLDWTQQPPVALPAEARWTGVLRVPAYRDFTLTLDLPGTARLSLDGAVVAEGTAPLRYTGRLYKGDHPLTVEGHVEGRGKIQLSWDDAAIPASAFLDYPLKGHGLIVSFYANENWQGDPKLVQLDPFVGVRIHSEFDDVGRPFTAAWTGFLDAPLTGDYSFELQAVEEGTLIIDGQSIPATVGTKQPVRLEQGRHSIEVRLFNKRGGATAMLYWTPPNGDRATIPAERFFPR